uniref:Uncharacterized protein n=1 Tax=Oryza meridionalis TaxID=40149 RepID=A0A0E0FEQ9_9ORYZ
MATMAPRLLIVVVSVLFTAGIIASAAAARDLTADPAGQVPSAYDFGIPAGFFVPGNNNPYNGDPAAWAAGRSGNGYAAGGGGGGCSFDCSTKCEATC